MSEKLVGKELVGKELVDSVIPDEIRKFLYDDRYMAIGDNFFKATAKLSHDKFTGDNKYSLHFMLIKKETIIGATGKANAPKEILKGFSFDYAEPYPCNLQDKYEFIKDEISWNSYNYPPWKTIEVSTGKELIDKCRTTLQLYKHIYEDSLMLGLDYATVEFMKPLQSLPAQVLYSQENITGKSTLLLHKLFTYGKNGAIIDRNTFADKFNGMTVGKNFIGIDEGKLQGQEGVDKIKNLITSPTIPYRAMRQEAREVSNFGKYYIATNDPYFGKIDKEDTRFWVINPKKIKYEFDPEFEHKLKQEMPYWLGFLRYRWDHRHDENVSGIMKMNTPEKIDRLWFPFKSYKTDMFTHIVIKNMPMSASNFIDGMIEWFDTLNKVLIEQNIITEKITSIKSNAMMIKKGVFAKNFDMTNVVIKKVLEKDLNITPLMDENGKKKQVRFINYISALDIDGKFNSEALKKTENRDEVFIIDYFRLKSIRDGEDRVDGDVEDAPDEATEEDVLKMKVDEPLPF